MIVQPPGILLAAFLFFKASSEELRDITDRRG